MQIFAAIALKNGMCVYQAGDATVEKDPISMAETWDAFGVDWLHITNLDGALDDAAQSAKNLDALQAILDRVNTSVQFGGGIRTPDDVDLALNMGINRAIIGSMAVDRPRQMLDILGQYGPEQIVLGLDVKEGKVVTHGWRKIAETNALDLVKVIHTAGLRHVIYSEVAENGTMKAINLEATASLAQAGQASLNPARNFQVIAAGDITGLETVSQVKAIVDQGIEGLVIGQPLYTGLIDLGEALTIAHA